MTMKTSVKLILLWLVIIFVRIICMLAYEEEQIDKGLMLIITLLIYICLMLTYMLKHYLRSIHRASIDMHNLRTVLIMLHYSKGVIISHEAATHIESMNVRLRKLSNEL